MSRNEDEEFFYSDAESEETEVDLYVDTDVEDEEVNDLYHLIGENAPEGQNDGAGQGGNAEEVRDLKFQLKQSKNKATNLQNANNKAKKNTKMLLKGSMATAEVCLAIGGMPLLYALYDFYRRSTCPPGTEPDDEDRRLLAKNFPDHHVMFETRFRAQNPEYRPGHPRYQTAAALPDDQKKKKKSRTPLKAISQLSGSYLEGVSISSTVGKGLANAAVGFKKEFRAQLDHCVLGGGANDAQVDAAMLQALIWCDQNEDKAMDRMEPVKAPRV